MHMISWFRIGVSDMYILYVLLTYGHYTMVIDFLFHLMKHIGSF